MGTVLDSSPSWSRVIATASQLDGLGPEARRAHLAETLGLGAGLTATSVGCSITEQTPSGFRTSVFSGSVALELDKAQYAADDGPCIAACRDGQVHSVAVMGAGSLYSSFTAAAVRAGVHSSLSLPLGVTERPSALNLYAADRSAFEAAHVRATAALLARCVAALANRPAAGGPELPMQVATASATADFDLAQAAVAALQSRHGLDPSQAFHRLTQLSRTEQTGFSTVCRRVLADATFGSTA